MSLRDCKYEQGLVQYPTRIRWDNKLNAFVEEDGRLHDRKRCEEIRGTSSTSTSTSKPQQQQQQQPQRQQAQTQAMATYDVAQTLAKVEGLMQTLATQYAPITRELQRLSEMYNDLLDFVRMTAVAKKREQEMAEAEAQYDQDKENGLV